MHKGIRAIHIVTLFTMLFSACVGAVMVRFEVRPMWLDEWSVVYNMKTKTVTQLWGQLDFMQQFPRVYLSIIQSFSSSYDYSYSSLRLPAFVTGIGVTTVKQLIPLSFTAIGCVLFYIFDLRQLAADNGMHSFWSTSMFDRQHMFVSFFTGFYRLFAQVGSGLLFENIFGILGVVSFIYGCIVCVRSYIKKEEQTLYKQVYAYSCLLIVIAVILFLLGKLPLGAGRLNVFTIPAIAILIINFINQTAVSIRRNGWRIVLPVILYLGLIGNIFTSYNNYFSSDEYRQQMNIYAATQNALALSKAKKIPLLITPAFGFPYQDAIALCGNPEAAAWMVKAFPAYKVKAHMIVYAITDTTQVQQRMSRLPSSVTSVIAGDGLDFREVARQQ